MRDATNPDPANLIKSLNDANNKKTLFQKDEKGRTALDWARLTRNYQAVTILMNVMSTAINNARVSSINTFDKLEHLIIQTNETQGIQLREAIRSRNARLAEQILTDNKLIREEVEALGQVFFTDWIGKVGYSPLILAAGMNMKEAVRELVNLRAPINHANRYGHTALTVAANAGNADITYFLVFSGADVYHKTKENRTALHYACLFAKAKIVKVIIDHLLERFAVFRNDDHSLTEFDYTRWTTYSNMVTNLLNVRDNDGYTAFELLPSKLEDMYKIEKRMKLSGGTGLPKLNQKPSDNRSVQMNLSLAGWEDDFEKEDHLEEGEDNFDQLSMGTPMNEEEDLGVFPPPLHGQHRDRDDYSELSSIDNSTNQVSLPDWSHNTDDQQVLEFHNLQDVFSIKTSLPLEKEVAYIQQLFDKINDRIIQWQISAAKEKALVQLIKCPLDCGAYAKVEDINTHVRDACPLRTLQCSLCHYIIRFKDVKQHDSHECRKRTITCKDCFHYLNADELDRHKRMLCIRRMVHCRQLCDLRLPFNEREMHELEHCPNRYVNCDQCQEVLKASDYPVHLIQSCPHRMVKCSIGCGDSFKAKDIPHHENNECQRYCKWNCGRKIGPPIQLSYHELTDCPEKPVPCCYSCGIPNLTLSYKKEHEKWFCSHRFLSCEKGCGILLQEKDCASHYNLFLGDCLERIVVCPSNLIGWKVKLMEQQLDGIVMKYERKLIHESDDQESSDEIYVKTAKGSFWFNIWKTKFTLLNKQSFENKDLTATSVPSSSSSKKAESSTLPSSNYIEDHLSCGWITRSSLKHHLEFACVHRKVFVKNNLFATVDSNLELTAEQEPQHQQPLFTSKGQRIELQSAIDLSQHLNEFDQLQSYLENPDYYQCEYCGNYLQKSLRNDHLDKECEFIEHFCPIGCGMKLKRKEIFHHTENLCSKRNVICSLCSRKDLWAEELASHQENECPCRMITCSLNCGQPNIRECDMIHHQSEECPNRPIQCECGMSFPSKELPEHKRLNCINRVVGCPQGCGQSMPLFLVDNHIEYFCLNRNHIYDRIEECPNGCGISMMRKELLQHVTTDCPKRLIECTLFCGNTCTVDLLPSKRHIS
jgi:hypothetical protein